MPGTGYRQEAILKALEGEGCLRIDQLASLLQAKHRAVSAATAALIKKGLLERREIGCFALSSKGREALAQGLKITSGPNGPLTKPRRLSRSAFRLRLWRAMAVLRSFTLSELAGIAGVKRETARKFIKELERIGYLRCSHRRVPGLKPSSNGFKHYRMIKHTGAQPPGFQASKGGIFDPNTGEVFLPGGTDQGNRVKKFVTNSYLSESLSFYWFSGSATMVFSTNFDAVLEATVFLDHFEDLPDPRQVGKIVYPPERAFIVVAACRSFWRGNLHGHRSVRGAQAGFSASLFAVCEWNATP